jgi:hypothetical protein
MTGGAWLSMREGERESARAGAAAVGPRVLLGCAGERGRASRPLGWAEPGRKEKGVGPSLISFFFLKI